MLLCEFIRLIIGHSRLCLERDRGGRERSRSAEERRKAEREKAARQAERDREERERRKSPSPPRATKLHIGNLTRNVNRYEYVSLYTYIHERNWLAKQIIMMRLNTNTSYFCSCYSANVGIALLSSFHIVEDDYRAQHAVS